jgi:hypothetical protein
MHITAQKAISSALFLQQVRDGRKMELRFMAASGSKF